MKKAIERSCNYCGKKFFARLSEVIKYGWGKFCSMPCQRKGRVYPSLGPREGFVPYFKLHPELAPRGKKHKRWKGGKFLDTRGYILIQNKNHPSAVAGYIRKHRLIMEKHIGRYLLPKEIVHHINGIKTDNRIKNLILFKSQSEHIIWHKNKATHWGHRRHAVDLAGHPTRIEDRAVTPVANEENTRANVG